MTTESISLLLFFHFCILKESCRGVSAPHLYQIREQLGETFEDWRCSCYIFAFFTVKAYQWMPLKIITIVKLVWL
jgi:hypothetical protein